jgi:DNA invertase Pin-like site-specific DNA recombinase
MSPVKHNSRGYPSLFDTTSAHGELLLTMLGAIATFERRLIKQRCSEGIARAKAEGKHLGRKPALNVHQRREALRMLGDGETQRTVARLLGVGQATIARVRRVGEASRPGGSQ